MRSRKGSDIVINIGSTKELGELIMHERKAQGLTQTQLAGLSGVGITFLSNLENGKQTAELGKTLNVLATLGLDLLAERRDNDGPSSFTLSRRDCGSRRHNREG